MLRRIPGCPDASGWTRVRLDRVRWRKVWMLPPVRTGSRLGLEKDLFVEKRFTRTKLAADVPSRSNSPCGTQRGHEPGRRGFVECELTEVVADRMPQEEEREKGTSYLSLCPRRGERTH